jgi:hypothetical protein
VSNHRHSGDRACRAVPKADTPSDCPTVIAGTAENSAAGSHAPADGGAGRTAAGRLPRDLVVSLGTVLGAALASEYLKRRLAAASGDSVGSPGGTDRRIESEQQSPADSLRLVRPCCDEDDRGAVEGER